MRDLARVLLLGRIKPWLSLGFALLFLPFSIYALTLIQYWLGILPSALSWVWIAAANLLAWRPLAGFGFTGSVRAQAFLGALTTLIFLVVTVIAGAFLDSSYDGQWYHQSAILELAAGWNPLRTVPGGPSSWFLQQYSKFSWIYSSAILRPTGQIEIAKNLTLLLTLSSAFVGYGVIRAIGRSSRRLSAWLAVLLALNPVSLVQSLSFYVDGILASLLLLFALTGLLGLRVRAARLSWVASSCALVMLLNTKNYAPFYAGLAVVSLALSSAGKWSTLRWTALQGGVAVLGICFFGYSPYLTNLKRQQPMTAPVRAEWVQASKIPVKVQVQSPKNLAGQSRIYKLGMSLFARTENPIAPAESNLKLPLLVTWDEVRSSRYPDIRAGGFGPEFGAMILLALGILAAVGWRSWGPIAWVWVPSLLSVLANPEGWWARFSPQLWPLPLLVGWQAIRMQGQDRVRRAGVVLLGLASFNLLLLSLGYVMGKVEESGEIRQQLENLARSGSKYEVNFNRWGSMRLRFNQWKIPFVEVANWSCPDKPLVVSFPPGSWTNVGLCRLK